MSSVDKQRRARIRAFAASVAVVLVLALAPAVIAAEPFAEGGIDGLTIPRGPQGTNTFSLAPPNAAIPRDPITVPFWVGSYQYNGQGYAALMVGTDPAQGSATTTVPVVIVPMRMVFARDGSVLEYPGMGQELANSPFFTSVPYVTGTTQYLDAYRRADFWTQVATTSPDYHTLLGTPTVTPTVTLNVPAALGHTFADASTNRSFGYVDGTWLSLQLKQLIGSLRIDPRALVVFLAANTLGTISSPDVCPGPDCFGFAGYHGALISGNPLLGAQPPQSVNTFAYAAFLDLGDAVPSWLNVHLQPTSHELLEWLDDPLIFSAQPSQQASFLAGRIVSVAPAWTSPYWSLGCSEVYEVADPLADGGPLVGVPDAGRIDVFADAVFQSWFARSSPSTAFGGRYDLIGFLQHFSDSCS